MTKPTFTRVVVMRKAEPEEAARKMAICVRDEHGQVVTEGSSILSVAVTDPVDGLEIVDMATDVVLAKSAAGHWQFTPEGLAVSATDSASVDL